MAAVTLLGSATFNTSSGTKTVTGTPALNDLIVIVTANSGSTSGVTPTDDQGGTYVSIANCAKVTSADRMEVFVRTSRVSSAVSTVFTHAPGTTSGGGLAVLKVTGMLRAGSSAVRQSAVQNNQASGTPAPVFGSAALTGNAVIGSVFNGANPATMTPRASFTERADVGYNTPASGLEVMSRDSGETGTTQTWGSSSGTAFCSLVLELDTTDPTQALTPSLFTNSQAFPAATVIRGFNKDPGFDDPSYWLTSGGWTVSGSKAGGTAVTGWIWHAPANIVSGTTYTYSFTVSNYSAGSVRAYIGPTPAFSISASANGTYTGTFTATTSGELGLNAPDGFTGEIDNFQIDLPVVLEPSLLTNTQSFYSQTVSPGAVVLTPTLLNNGQAFQGPAITAGYSVAPALFTNSQTFHAATVSRGTLALSPALFTNGQTFHAASVDAVKNLAPALFSNSQTIYGATVSQSTPSQNLSPSPLTNGQIFHSASTAVGAVGLTPSLAINGQTFFAPAVTRGTMTLSPPLTANNQTFFSAAVSRGAVALSPSLATNSQGFFVPAVVVGSASIAPGLFTNSQSFHSPTVANVGGGGQSVIASLLTNSQTFHSATVTRGTIGLSPALFENSAEFYAPAVGRGAIVITSPLVTNSITFFNPAVSAANDIGPPLVVNPNQLFAPDISGSPSPQTVTSGLFVNVSLLFGPTLTITMPVPPARVAAPEPVSRVARVGGRSSLSSPSSGERVVIPSRRLA